MIEFEDDCGLELDDLGTLEMVTKAKYDKVVKALAASQQALGEIAEIIEKADCISLSKWKHIAEIARNAVKGGK